MFCGKCGAPLEEDSMFCNECGAKVEKPDFQIQNQLPDQGQDMHYVSDQAMVQKKPALSERWKQLDTKGKAICTGIVLAVILVVAVYWHNSSLMKLNQYVDVEFTGYDGIGRAQVVFDDEAFLNDYGDKIKSDKKSNSFLDALAETESFEDEALELLRYEYIGYELDTYDHLKNGDEVTLTWNCEDSAIQSMFGKKPKYSDITFTVDGLDTVELVDPFEKVEIQYEGVAPYGYAYIASTGKEAYVQDLWYQMEPEGDLSNGDTVRVYISGYDEEYFAEQYGIGFSGTEKTYTVSGLGEYVSTADDISEDMLEQMIAQGTDVITAYAAKNWDSAVSLDEVAYAGNYFLKAKGNGSYTQNKLILVYAVEASIAVEDSDEKEKVSYYTYVTYSDLINVEEGKTMIDLQTYETCSDSFVVEVEAENSWWNRNYRFIGYQDLNMLMNQTVVVCADQFSSEDNIED